jgi:hypothetical protein
VDIAILVYNLNRKYREEIEGHYGLRNIIDIQFDRTWEWFRNKFLIYFLGYFVPFTLQLFSVAATYWHVVPLLVLCLMTLTLLQLAQLLKIRGLGWRDYYRDKYNIITDANYVVFIFYVFHRMRFIANLLPSLYANDPNYKGKLDEAGFHDKSNLAMMSFFNLSIYIVCGFELMSFMRIHATLGSMEHLVT